MMTKKLLLFGLTIGSYCKNKCSNNLMKYLEPIKILSIKISQNKI